MIRRADRVPRLVMIGDLHASERTGLLRHGQIAMLERQIRRHTHDPRADSLLSPTQVFPQDATDSPALLQSPTDTSRLETLRENRIAKA
jgi:hypothetical protein